MKTLCVEDQYALDMSVRDAYKCARRLSRCCDDQAHSAALRFAQELRKLGANPNGRRELPATQLGGK